MPNHVMKLCALWFIFILLLSSLFFVILIKVADYELNRRKRMEENRREAEKLKLKEKANELVAGGKSKTRAKKPVLEDFSDLEFDRAYVSGHDSISEEQEEHFIPKVLYNFIQNIQGIS